jgi:hypothetical protein
MFTNQTSFHQLAKHVPFAELMFTLLVHVGFVATCSILVVHTDIL